MNKNELDNQDLSWAVKRLPTNLKAIMKEPEWSNAIFVGGGYIRAIVGGEKINDVDVFVKSAKEAELLAHKLTNNKRDIVKTDNAFTVKGKLPIQIIYRWLFEKKEDVANSFDFTVCCAVIACQFGIKNGEKEPKPIWESYCDERFYIDLASKRLVYRSPVRNEDAGGSMLRVLKYYQRGYRIPLDSLGAVMARLVKAVDPQATSMLKDEAQVAKVLTGLLREVDPNIDPTHESHLPAQKNETTEE